LVAQSKSQSVLADFENLTLPANSAYSSTASISFSTSNATFMHTYDVPFAYWSGGFAYTNKKDSSTAGSGNLYGVRAFNGYNASNYYVVCQDKGIIKLNAPSNSVEGFYYTNTTYAYKSMKSGDMFSKKFGGVSGNDPDYLKLTVKGYLNGVLKTDSVEIFLANFTYTNNAQDFIVATWQFANTSTLGQVDSIKFFMYSTDMSGNFMNTPAFFAIDNFSTAQIVGIHENELDKITAIYPNPFQSKINIEVSPLLALNYTINIFDVNGKNVTQLTSTDSKNKLDLTHLNSGIYFVEVTMNGSKSVKKIIKN
jgi:hypothetical protein